jgi:NADP-dependent 3-hydroxy acid dehydrogenase YdfG
MSSTKAAEDATAAGRLTGVTAVVTGASRGIGLAIAEALVARDARVAMIARGEAALRAHCQRLGPRAIPVVCDVTNNKAVDSAVATIVEGLGGAPDVLVNNAGSFTLAPIESVDPTSFAAELDTNLVAPLRLIHAFLPAMRSRRRGHVVTIGSVADRTIFPQNASYAASKFGARALHEVLRHEMRGSGVRATLVSPAQVDTPMWDPIDPDHRPGFTPRVQMLQASAVADAVVYAVTQPPDVNVDELRLSHS